MILSSWLTTVSNRIRNASARRRLSRKYKGNRYAHPSGMLGSSSTTYSRPAGDIRESLWHTFDVAPRFHKDSRRFQRQAWNTSDVATMTEKLEDRTLLSAISINNASVAEGDAGTVMLVFTVSQDSATAGESVNYAIAGVTASAGVDYDDTTTSGTITFDGTNNPQQIMIPVFGDTTVEANETLTVVLGGATGGATIAAGTGTGTITNDDFDTEVTLAGGVLTITDVNGADTNDALTISYSGGNYTITDTSGKILSTAIAGATGQLSSTLVIPDTGVSGINFDTLGGDDSVTVNSVQASLSGDFTIDGGSGVDSAVINAVIASTGTVDISVSRNIVVNSGSSITATAGDITLTANRGVSAVTGDFDGIYINNATVTATTGNITLNARSGNTASDDGIELQGATIETTGAGSGTITLNGDGVTGGDDGLDIYDGTVVRSVDGAIQLTGNSVDSEGVIIETGADVISTGIATITINGTVSGAAGTDAVFLDDAGTTITSVDGNISITGNTSGSGSFAYGIQMETGVVVRSTGTAQVILNGTSSNGDGITTFETGTLITSVTGDISITGTTSGSTTSDHGIQMNSGSAVSSTGTAQVMLNGMSSNGEGIQMHGAGTLVTSLNGPLSIMGTGGDYGVYLYGNADITSTGSATITVNGTVDDMADGEDGIFIGDAGTTITSVTGDISITGNTIGSGASDNGIELRPGSAVSSTGTAQVMLNGMSSNGEGVLVETSMVTSLDGPLSVMGTGGNYGVSVFNDADVTSTGSATITIIGSVNNAAGADGVYIEDAGTLVTSMTGNISITGNTIGSGTTVHGIQIGSGSVVSSTGSAQVTLDGTSSNAAGGDGVSIDATNTEVASVNGTIMIDGTSSNLNGVSLTGTATIAAAGIVSDVILNTNTIDIAGTATIQGTGDLIIEPQTAGTSIGLGNGSSGTLNLSAAELGSLADGFTKIIIGDATSGTGTIDVNASTFTDPVTIVGGAIAVTGLDAGSDAVTLTARTGAITDGGDSGTDVTGGAVTLQTLDATTGDIGASGDAISLAATSLTTDSSASGDDQFLSEVGSVSVSSVDVGVGTLEISGGEFDLTTEAIANTSSVSVESAATLDINGVTDTFDALSIASGGIVSGAGTVAANVSGAAGSAITSGGTLNLGNAASSTGFATDGTLTANSGHVVTLNDSDLALLGSSTVVNGTLVAANGLSMSSGDTVSGGGTITADLSTNSGSIKPGNSPGILSITGNLDLADGTFELEIDGTTAGTGAGFHDQIDVTGTVNLGSNAGGDEVTLTIVDLGVAVSDGDEFLILDNDAADAITGTFSVDFDTSGTASGARTLVDGDIVSTNFLGSGKTARISYVAGDGNDVAIVVDEPTATAGPADDADNANSVSVVVTGDTVQVIDDGEVIESQPLDGIDNLVINGVDGDDDAVDLDFDTNTGLLNLAGITVALNTNTGDDVNVTVNGQTLVLNLQNLTDGQLVIDGGPTITLTGVSQNTISVTGSNDLSITFGNTADNIVFNDNAAANTSQVSGDNFVTTTFTNPSNSLAVTLGTNGPTATFTDLDTNFNPANGIDIDGGVGADIITVTDLGDSFTGHFDAQLGGGADSVTFETNNQNAGQLTLTAETITATAAALTVSGTTTLDAGTGTVLLNNAGHDFQGDVTVVSAGATTLVDTNALTVADSATTGTTDITAGTSLTLNDLNSSGQTVTLTATAGSIIDGNGGTNNLTATSLTASAATGISLDTTITTLTSATTSGTGAIDISDSAGGLTATTVTSNDGAVTLNATGGNLTVGTSVTAGGSNNATLSTTTSGNVILTGTTTADGNQVTITSAGAINGAGLVTASTIDINAASGIGSATVVELAGSTITADVLNGEIDINNTLATAVSLSTMTTTNGFVSFDQSGGGDLTTGTVSATTSTTITNSAGAIALDGSVTSASLVVTATGDVTDGADGDLAITNNASITGASITLGDTAGNDTDFGSLTFTSAAGAVSITEDSATELTGTSTGDSLTLVSAGAVTDATNTDVTIDNGNASITGTSISLADQATDTLSVSGTASFDGGAGAITVAAAGAVDFGNLVFNTTGGAVSITEDSSTTVSAASTAGAGLTLSSADDVTLDDTVDVTGATSITAGTTANGHIDVNAKLTGTTTILLDAADEITIDAAIDPTTVTLEADDDIDINAAVVATTLITISAGQDGTGDANINSGGTLTTTNAGSDIAITSGATTGAIALAEDVTAVDRITLTSNGTGNITQTAGTLSATNLQVTAVGNATLNQATNDVDTLAADLNPGIFQYTDADGVEVGTVGTSGIATGNGGNGGAVTINATSGTINVTQSITTSPGTGGGISLSGAVTIGASLTAAGGTITLNGNTAATSDLDINADLVSDQPIVLTAPQDILVGALVQTVAASGSAITLTADSDSDASGGVLIELAGQVDSDSDATITGSDGVNASFTANAGVEIDSDGANVQVLADGNITIGDGTNAPVTSTTIINGVVQAATTGGTIDITAEDDVTFGVDGDVLGVDGTVTVTADSNGDANGSGGAVTMADGAIINAGSGTIDIDADENITLGSIQTTDNTGAAVAIDSVNGGVVDGGGADVDIVADSASAVVTITTATGIGDTGANDAIETTVATLNASVNGTGSIDINETNAIVLVDVDTNNGSIQVDAGGQLTATDVASTTDNDANDITLTTAAGDILVNLINAGAAGDVTLLNTGAGIEETAADGTADITADDLRMEAVDGVGNDGEIEIAVSDLAVTTASGDITLVDTAGGLTITTITTAGASITAGAAGDDIIIRAESPLTVDSAVTNTGGGDITLAAEGNTVTDDLDINANVTATGGNGAINLFAGDSIDVDPAVTISAVGTGDIIVTASTDFNAGTPQNGFDATAAGEGDVNMQSGSTIQTEDGSIGLAGDGDVNLSIVNADSNSNGGDGTVLITADFDGVGTGLADNEGAITDNLAAETANITALNVAFRAGDGVGTDADNINTASLTGQTLTIAVETESGDVNILNVGSLTVGTVDALSGVTITDADTDDTGNDNITLIASSPLTVNQSITNADGGNITLTATNDGGQDDDLTISANVTATGGNGAIDLNAGTDLIVNNDAVVSTVGTGNIDGDAVRAIAISTTTAAVQSVAGDITLLANAGGAAGNFAGITVNDATISTTSGAISLTGTGGDAGDNNHGVFLTNTATISSTGNDAADPGTVIVTGIAGIGASSDGVNVTNGASHTFISTVDAEVSIIGNSGTDDGVLLFESRSTTTGLGGLITIMGTTTATGGDSNTGVTAISSAMSTMGNMATISVTGVSTENDGVRLNNSDSTTTGLGGSITIMGTTTGTGGGADGVTTFNSAMSTMGDTATISVTGETAGDDGVELTADSDVTTAGASTATITIMGTTTGANGANSEGVLISSVGNDVTITSAAGAILITGEASGTSGDGVEIEAGIGEAIDANGGATITIIGTGDEAESAVQIDSPITSEAGFVTIQSEDGGSTTDDITFGAEGNITSISGTITIDADTATSNTADVFMADDAVIDAGSGQIDIDADVDVTLGSVQTTSTTEPSIEIDAIAGGVIDGGDTDTDIVLAADGTLAIRAATGVGSANAIDTNLTTTEIAVSNSTSGNVQIDNSTAAFATSKLTVETVDGTVGIVNSGTGAVALTNASAIDVEDNITSGGNITVTLNDNAGFMDNLFVAGRVSAGGAVLLISSTTGDITFNIGDDGEINGDITTGGAATRVTFNMDPAGGDAETADVATDGAELKIASDPISDFSVITTNSAGNPAAGTFINGGNQNDIFNFAPQSTTDFVVNGNPPDFGDADVPPGDILNLDLVNVTRGNAILNIGDPLVGDDASAGFFTFQAPETEQTVSFTSIETVSAVDSLNPATEADYHLVVDLGIVGPNAAGASTDGYQDGTADTVDIRLNAAGSGDVEVRIDDGGGAVQVYAGQNDQILSLTVIGTSDDETVVLTETAAGLPAFSTLDEEPVGTSIALAAPAIDNTASNGGVSAGAHLGAAFETHIDREPVEDANSDLDIESNHVTLHFEGGTGTNALQFDFLTDKEVSYFSDLVDVTNKDNSGNIGIVDFVTDRINLAVSFANLDPIDINGAGGFLRIDATDTPATYELTITDVGGADGDNQIVGDNGFETTNFSGFANVEIYGGTGSEIIDLVTLDGTTPANAGAEALVTLRLDGDNTGNQAAGSEQIGTDTAADRIHVRSLPGSVDLTIFGGAGDDQFEIFSEDTAGDSANTVDQIRGQIIISPTFGSGPTGEDSQDEAGTDSLTIVDRADASGDTVNFTHSGSSSVGTGVATIDGLFDMGTGVDLTVNVNIDELTVVTTDGDDTLNLDFRSIQHDLDNVAIYAAGGQDNFVFAADSNTPGGATILLDGDELATDATVPTNTGINNDTIDFSAFSTARTVTLTGVGPTSVTLTSNAAFTLDAGGGVAATTDTLNALVNNTVQYPAAGTDILVISGTDTDGNAFSTNFSVNSLTTIQDLLDAINVEYDGAVVTLNGSGELVVTANATGPVTLALAIVDRVGNTGATTFPTMVTTDDGLGGSNETLQTATALTLEAGGVNAVGTTRLNDLASNAVVNGGVDYDGAAGTGADTIVITGVDTSGAAVAATLTNVGAATTVNDLLGAINGAFAGATAELINGVITLRADAEGILPLELVINDGATSDGSTRWDNHIFVQTTLGTSIVVDGFTGSETSINGTFTNIDSLRGPDTAGDILVAPDLNNHWDLFNDALAADSARGNNLGGFSGTDHGNLVASRSTADARIGGATTVGRPTADVINTTVPITAVFPEQDLIFASFENLVGGSLSDHFDLRDAASVSGPINGSGGNDSIDYRDYTNTSVQVDLFTGTATNIMGGAAGGLVAGVGGGADDNSIENAIGGSANDFIAGDNDDNILGDGPGSDYLNGGGFKSADSAAVFQPGAAGFIGAGTSGDDIFRIEPISGSNDIIQDIAGSDTVDFRFATAGIGDTTTSFDMDITSDGQGVGATQIVNNDGGANIVDFRRITLPLTDDPNTAPTTTVIPQPETSPSFVENFIGSTFNDYIFIDPLSLSGNFPVGSPPVARSVDGNNPPNANILGGTDPIPAGDTLDFDSKGKTVLDTGLSLTAVGVGTVAYRDIETLIPFENAPGRVLDNTDVGFTLEGDATFPSLQGWQLETNSGAVGGTQYNLHSPEANDLARWTFNGVTPGLYRVSATWGADSTTSTTTLSAAAPFTILDGDRAVAQELMDLQSLPDDFIDVGVVWEDIAGLVWISGHSLVVELDPADGQSVVADSVRIERLSIETTQLASAIAAGVTTLDVVDATVFPAPNFDLRIGQETVNVTVVNIATNQLTLAAMTTAAHFAGDYVQVERPEVQVQVGSTLLLDGNGELDFGITRPGTAIEQTVRIFNAGIGDLTVTAGALLIGFTTTLAAGPTTVTAGESLSFGITMTAAAAGDFAADFKFTTNDLDEDEYSFRVAGSVADAVVVDDEDPTFEVLSGDWNHVVGAGFEGDYSIEGSQVGASASWTFTNLVAGRYRVSATWPQTDLSGNALDILNATDVARFQVFDGAVGVMQLADTVLNQTIAPDDITADGAVFEDIATSVVLTGTTLTVQLSHSGDDADNLLADAIRIERLPDQILTVTADGGATPVIDDTGVVSFGTSLTAEPVTKTFTLTNNSAAGNDITLTGPITPPAGFSLVQSSTFGTDGTAVTLTPTQSTTFILQYDGGVAGTVTGRVSIDTDVDVNDPFDFLVTGSADAEVIDNSDAGFAVPNGTISPSNGLLRPGFWFETSPASGPVGGSYLAKVQGLGTDVARWTFDVTPGVYSISATWPGTDNASTAAPYQIFENGGSDNGGTLLLAATANQKSRPTAFLDGNAFWDDLGVPVTTTAAATTLVVELSDLFASGGIVTADAVRIERITDPEITVTNGGASLEDAVSSVGFGTTPAGTSVLQTFIVQNFGGRNMFVDQASLAASVAALPGFSLITPFTSTEIAPGGSSVFQIQLDAASAGLYSGTIEFAADDFDEQLFEILVTGDVLDGAATVVDNGGAGFDDVNGNLTSVFLRPNTGFAGDAVTSIKGSTPAGEATWTFGTLTAGNIYRLSTTWLDYLPYQTTVTYSVYAGDTATGTLLRAVEINQNEAPDDFVVGGIGFEELMEPFTLPAGQTMLTVQLIDSSMGASLVVADAVRLDALTAPELIVADAGTTLTSGNSTVSFGTTAPGTSVTRTITVTNDGNAALQLSGIQLPNGFSSTFVPVSVPMGTDSTFDVTLDAALTGDFFGDIVLTTDDPDQSEFSFSVSGTSTNIRIVDNGDVGTYASTGFQSVGAGIGFQLDIEEPTTPGSVTDTATWTFAGLANGIYRVSATWDTSNVSHATNAPFSIYDAATATGTPVAAMIDQSQDPDDFSDDGAFWEDLGVPFTVTNGALTVQLTGLANGIVLADAIRVEPVTTPEIGVTLTTGGANIADGGLLNFGEIAVGAAAAAGTINVTVTNFGVGTLELGNFLVPSNGYTVANLGSSALVGNGTSTTFDIVLDTVTAGTFTGVVSFGTNDSDEAPFDIVVLGTISDSIIIDDGDPAFATAGAGWVTESGFAIGFGNDVAVNPGSVNAGDVATWTFSNLQDGGRYRVSTTWDAASGNASNATYSLTGGAAPQEVMFNQGLAPANTANATTGTINDRDETFVNIGDIYQLAAGTTTLTVTLSAVADGRVLADAVRVELIDDAEIKVTQGTTNVQDGGTFDFGTTATGTATQITFTVENQGALDLTLNAASLAASLGALAGYSLDTTFGSTTLPPGQMTTFVVQLDAAAAGTFAGIISFTSNDADESPFNVVVTGIVVTPVAFDGATPLIIDDGDQGFSSVLSTGGTWFDLQVAQGFNADQLISFGSTLFGTSTATWTATAVAGTARIAATWPQLAFASQAAEFSIYDGTALPGNLVATVTANQGKLPGDGLAVDGVTPDGFTANGADWDELGTFTFNSGTITIELAGGLNGFSIADAIRISPINALDTEASAVPSPSEPNLVFDNLRPIFDAAINTWSASGQISDEQLIELQNVIPVITDLPGTQVGQLVGSVMYLDINAAGNGWFVDASPEESSEFNTLTALTERVAGGNSHAVDDIDLLTVVLHEFGHVLGQPHLNSASNPADLMSDVLPTGVRRLPESVNAVTSTGAADLTVQLPETAGHVDLSLFDGYLVIQSNHAVLERIAVDTTQTLTINGTEGADNFRIDLDQSGDLNIESIVVHGYGDDDDIVFDGVPNLFSGSLTIGGDGGHDRIEVRGGQATQLTLNGSDGNDTLFGGLGAESINGGDGDDMLSGGADADRINGGGGRDMIWGNAGSDTLVGGNDDDTVKGGAGHDVLTGGFGNDVLDGQQGNDTLLGHAGDDVLNGGSGRDALSGGEGNDKLRGGSQNDFLSGGLGDDEIHGNIGHDILAGDDGDDSLAGGHGNDSLDGGAGVNYFFGQQAVDSLFGASALREELLQNPQSDVPALAAGSDIVMTTSDDSTTATSENSDSSIETEESATTQSDEFNIDSGFNLFAEWIDLV